MWAESVARPRKPEREATISTFNNYLSSKNLPLQFFRPHSHQSTQMACIRLESTPLLVSYLLIPWPRNTYLMVSLAFLSTTWPLLSFVLNPWLFHVPELLPTRWSICSLCSQTPIQVNRDYLVYSMPIPVYIYIYIYIYMCVCVCVCVCVSSSSSSGRAASTDIPDPLSPLLPIIHRFWQVFRTTSRILT